MCAAVVNMYVFVIGNTKNATRVARYLYDTYNLTPPKSQKWNQHLCCLAHGGAYDQIAAALNRQVFTLLYGYPWSHEIVEAEMRLRFPDALWIRAEDDDENLSLEACLPADCKHVFAPSTNESLSRYTHIEDVVLFCNVRTSAAPWPFPCACTQMPLVYAFTDVLPRRSDKSCFALTGTRTDASDIALFVDHEYRSADVRMQHQNVAWTVEGEAIHPGCAKAMRAAAHTFVRVYQHGAATADSGLGVHGHIPFGAVWVVNADATVVKQTRASCISSSKRYAPGHKFRCSVMEALADDARVERFGAFVHRHIVDKGEALMPFMYSIIIENDREEGLWTEKISDCCIARCVAFYWGAPNIHDWFDAGSVLVFETVSDLQLLLATMSVADYESRQLAIENNYHRAAARLQYIDNLALDCDLLSLPSSVTPCRHAAIRN